MLSCMLLRNLLDSDCAYTGKTRLVQHVSARSRRKRSRTGQLHMSVIEGIEGPLWVALGSDYKAP